MPKWIMRLVPDVRLGAVVLIPVVLRSIMVNFPGRNGRRRRVLNEEVLAASGSRASLRAVPEEPAGHLQLRYSEAAGVENHPQITDFVPRRYRTIALLVLTGAVSTIAVAGLHYAAPLLAATIGVSGIPPFDLSSNASLANWVAAVLLVLASVLCLLVYSIRRHRIDDYRGRYRIWLAASAACLLLSANSVAGLHHVLAYTLSHFTGWTALRGGAVWWLVVAGLPLGWVVFRTLRDVMECRLAAVLWVAALGFYAAAAVCYLGFAPAVAPPFDTMLDAVLALLGHWLLLASVVSYSRYVILDAQGLVPTRNSSAKTEAVAKRKHDVPTPPRSVGGPQQVNLHSPRAAPAAGKEWIDGSRPERDRYDDSDDPSPGGSRKLSKAERKRLRKFKAQNRAA